MRCNDIVRAFAQPMPYYLPIGTEVRGALGICIGLMTLIGEGCGLLGSPMMMGSRLALDEELKSRLANGARAFKVGCRDFLPGAIVAIVAITVFSRLNPRVS